MPNACIFLIEATKTSRRWHGARFFRGVWAAVALWGACTMAVAQGDSRQLFFEAFELLKAGQAAQAVAKFVAGLQIEPDNALARYYLGEAYLQAGDRQRALQQTLRSLQLDPNGETAPEARKRLASTPLRDCEECPEMVVIPAGSFQMGSPASEAGRDADEGPVREVRIVQAFVLGRYEVTQAQWQAVMGSNPSWFKDCGPDCPVENVSWDDAQEFVRRLSQRTGQRYRLPSEAEWEYAARAGSTTAYFWGDRFDGQRANNGNRTVAVGRYQPNAFGLHDMHGNVWEWVQDVWHDSYAGAPSDGTAWTTGGDQARRVVRGGPWDSDPQYLRSASRGRDAPGNRDYGTGFRIARTF